MSKIGRKPISTQGVQVELKNHTVIYKGKLASGSHELPLDLSVTLDNGNLTLIPAQGVARNRETNRIWGLQRALLSNKINGARENFDRKLQINGLGFKAAVTGKQIVFNLGFSHKINFDLPENVSATVDKTGQLLTIASPDRESVGHVCSEIKALRPPEPYKGTGIKFLEEVLIRKAGKAKSS